MILIGFIEISKKEKKGKLTIAIPFLNKTEFYVSANLNKKTESYPDFLIWHNKISVGGLWKGTYEKEGIEKKYFSGNIFAPGHGFEKNKLKIVIFEDNKGDNSEIFKGSVFWSQDEKNLDTPEEENTIMDDEGIL